MTSMPSLKSDARAPLRLAAPEPPAGTSVSRPLVLGSPRALADLLAQINATPGLPKPVAALTPDRLRDLAGVLDQDRPDAAILTHDESEAPLFAEALDLLADRGLPVRHVPPLRSLFPFETDETTAPRPARLYVAPGSTWSAARIDLAALLDRDPQPLDHHAVARLLRHKRVLITGAGGSIGSELARIVASFDPACVVLMERAENALFEIDRQLGARFPHVPRRAVLHDVVDADRTLQLLVDLRPDIIFHAAAHKHVPLMEDHPSHAVTNNFFGTKSIADAALAVGAERFVLISSDKAVNPTSVMGATKRLAEIYIQGLHRQVHAHPHPSGPCPTRFSMVRFGNVLGSSCSVVPIWSAQLVDGGPLTVTDARMTRYFMTIHEAAGLVIQAASIDNPTSAAPVYVLDMGCPVRILDLARRFLAAHGYAARLVDRDNRPLDADGRPLAEPAPVEPGTETIDVVLSGIRPGEKLHEELAYAAEQLRPTPYAGIHAWAGAPAEVSLPGLVADLTATRHTTHAPAVIATIRRHIPEMNRT